MTIANHLLECAQVLVGIVVVTAASFNYIQPQESVMSNRKSTALPSLVYIRDLMKL
jgi:hypothetical protein